MRLLDWTGLGELKLDEGGNKEVHLYILISSIDEREYKVAMG